MIAVVQFSAEPERLDVYTIENGYHDAWLRKNIRQIMDEEGSHWEADEKYLRTKMNRDEIDEQFDALFVDDFVPENVSVEERLDAIEAVILEMMEE